MFGTISLSDVRNVIQEVTVNILCNSLFPYWRSRELEMEWVISPGLDGFRPGNPNSKLSENLIVL
jgi:hypothetical protein